MLYKSLYCQSPHYIRAMVEFHNPERTGLCSDKIFQLLKVPNLKRKTFAARSYSVVAPMWWNELANSIKRADNIDDYATLTRAMQQRATQPRVTLSRVRHYREYHYRVRHFRECDTIASATLPRVPLPRAPYPRVSH